jgi:hypothetical protein
MHTTLVVHCLTYPCVKNIFSDSNHNGNAREKSGQEGNRGCAFQFGWFFVSGTLSSLLCFLFVIQNHFIQRIMCCGYLLDTLD